MAKYRKRPIYVEAFRWTIDVVPDWWRDFKGLEVDVAQCIAIIPVDKDTKIYASPGDWITREDDGFISVWSPSVFAKLYELWEFEDVDLPPDGD